MQKVLQINYSQQTALLCIYLNPYSIWMAPDCFGCLQTAFFQTK